MQTNNRRERLMSIDGQVLGSATVAGGGAGTAASLADTGNPVLIGLAVGFGLIVILGIVTRFAQRRQSQN